ncbi:ribose-phosphate pyrophosphokinase [Sphingorhabdus lacus]|uniref:ribose-phosphate pyrophosphokinase n=1 Tax=Sphingorhabdus lacus TaxID=392610 RepID=UPI001FE6D40A|nr:ribose-phosphate pyrophosphokinase [Sphingorhabdus lacus]
MDPILEDFLSDPAADLSALHDVARIKVLLENCAREGRAISYSELLLNLGFRFTRPKMRAVCKTLDRIDALTAQEGTPALAVLVVREGDGLPGQGWWTGRTDYQGQWTGPDAEAHIAKLQAAVFAYWKGLGR